MTTLSIMTHSITTVGIMTPSIMGLTATLSTTGLRIRKRIHFMLNVVYAVSRLCNVFLSVIMPNVIMLNVAALFM
jgi:hypothetical protein